MSERLPSNHERQERLEAGGQFEIAAHTAETPNEAQLEAEQRYQHREALAEAQEARAESDTKNPLEALQEAEKQAAEPTSTLVTPELKAATKRRQLQQVQRRLPAPERALSRVIHQPVIRAVSETAAATVSRPSGLLGGGLVALLGSSIYLYLTKHIGMSYNYFIFVLLFVGGFGFGLILELLVWSFTRSRRPE